MKKFLVLLSLIIIIGCSKRVTMPSEIIEVPVTTTATVVFTETLIPTATLVSTATPVPTATPLMAWHLSADSAAFSGRSGMVSLAYNSKMWLIGGTDGVSLLNEVWSGTNGNDWASATGNAAFSKRFASAGAVHDSGGSKMWTIGGFDGVTLLNDVWYSSDGVDWTMATGNAEFTPRYIHSVVEHNNAGAKLWVIGGQDISFAYKNDIWYSSDGISWTQATAAAGFDIRGFSAAVSFGGKLWIIGGYQKSGTYDLYYSDVWSSVDGAAWTKVVSAAPFAERRMHAAAVSGGKIWISGGMVGSTTFNDTWTSADGASWTALPVSYLYPPRSNHAMLDFSGFLWIVGGSNVSNLKKNDVWYLQ